MAFSLRAEQKKGDVSTTGGAQRLSFWFHTWFLNATLPSPRCFWRRYETWPGACRFPFRLNGPFQEKVARKSFLTNYGKISHRARWGRVARSSGLRFPSRYYITRNETPRPTDSPELPQGRASCRRGETEDKDFFFSQLRGREQRGLRKRFRVCPTVAKPLKSEGCLTGSVTGNALVDSTGRFPGLMRWCSSLG